MTRRDLAWRIGGGTLIALGCLPATVTAQAGRSSVLELLGFLVALAGIVLVVNGKRAAMALRVERSRHRNLPDLIHARRIDRSRRR